MSPYRYCSTRFYIVQVAIKKALEFPTRAPYRQGKVVHLF